MKKNKLTKSQYESIKKSYLHKNRCMFSLYREINETAKIEKRIFFKIINQIRIEEGYNPYYYSNQKKKNNTNRFNTHQYST